MTTPSFSASDRFYVQTRSDARNGLPGTVLARYMTDLSGNSLRNAHVRKMRNRKLAERVGASTAMRNFRTYSRRRFGARSRLAIAGCCTKNTAEDFANKMQNPGHL